MCSRRNSCSIPVTSMQNRRIPVWTKPLPVGVSSQTAPNPVKKSRRWGKRSNWWLLASIGPWRPGRGETERRNHNPRPLGTATRPPAAVSCWSAGRPAGSWERAQYRKPRSLSGHSHPPTLGRREPRPPGEPAPPPKSGRLKVFTKWRFTPKPTPGPGTPSGEMLGLPLPGGGILSWREDLSTNGHPVEQQNSKTLRIEFGILQWPQPGNFFFIQRFWLHTPIFFDEIILKNKS